MARLYILNGPETGRSFELNRNSIYVGRGSDNDIQIVDRTVSRRHLRIQKRGKRYFLTDLESRNGTFFHGSYVAPGLELEVKQGVPIAIGMSVICIGEGCLEQMVPFLDSVGLLKETGEGSGIFEEHRDKTNQKKLELLYNVSDVLMKNLPERETLQKVLDNIFDLLFRIDRGAFILLDPETKEIRDVVFKSKKPTEDISAIFCRDVVNRVVEAAKPLVVSDAHTEQDEIAETLKILKIESVMCIPLISGSEIIGVIYVDSLERPYGFRREDVSLFADLGQRMALAIESARFASEVSGIADELSSSDG
ncbi:MAG: FHA domain-containing protein [Deltaproteobacteria bacterium]|jgi:putative methionine-R-sulfoxide reductase with GAF domain